MDMKVTISREPLKMEFEAGSVEEALGILNDNKAKFVEMLDLATEMSGAEGGAETGGGEVATATTTEPPKPRGRKPRAGADPATATAPPPLAVPGAAPPTPPVPPVANAPAAPLDNGIPPFLQRTATDAAAAAPPPPVLPNAPSVAPAAATPQFILGGKIADALQGKVTGAADKGASLLLWLQHPGVAGALIVPTATIDEAISVMRFTTDDKVAHIAPLLGVAVS